MNIAIIPARGGSQRIPGKNKRFFHGKPIIQYSIDTAKKTGLFERIIVSTDDAEIAAIAINRGAWPIYRAAEHCQDKVGTQEVITQCAGLMPSTMICCIYATAPLMCAGDIDRAHRVLMERPEVLFAMSIGTEPLRDAGQFYFGRTDAFLKRRHLLASHTAMIPINESMVCDINTEEDWARAEKMYADYYSLPTEPDLAALTRSQEA